MQVTRPRPLLDNLLYAGLIGGVVLARGPLCAAWAAAVGALGPPLAFVLVNLGLYLAGHWLVVWGLDALERWAPAVVARHRLDPERGEADPPDLRRVVAVNQLVGMPLTLAALAGALALRGWDPLAPAPGVLSLLGQLFALGLCTEIGFYSTHRLLHTRPLYRRIHAIHHRYRSPHARAAPYMHILEFTVANAGPMAAGALIIGAHPLVLSLMVALAAINIAVTHAGVHLPGLAWATHHHLHHVLMRGNYGTLFVMDTALGTNRGLEG